MAYKLALNTTTTCVCVCVCVRECVSEINALYRGKLDLRCNCTLAESFSDSILTAKPDSTALFF